MSLKIQIIVAVLIVTALAGIANMVRKGTLDIKFALSWIMVGGMVLILDLFPGSMSYLVHLLGIELPVNMMFFFGFCFTLFLVFTLTVKVSRQSEQIKRLTQEVGLLEERMAPPAGIPLCHSAKNMKHPTGIPLCHPAKNMKGENIKEDDE
ncbi:MAG: DUF2304 domain-containing protein [Eubacterium sp.]|jgi:hypothetical protein|nr:DUF2304 domain-containing protein [Eubacterium sp.]